MMPMNMPSLMGKKHMRIQSYTHTQKKKNYKELSKAWRQCMLHLWVIFLTYDGYGTAQPTLGRVTLEHVLLSCIRKQTKQAMETKVVTSVLPCFLIHSLVCKPSLYAK